VNPRACNHTRRNNWSLACSDLKLYWSTKICAQITAQTEKTICPNKFCK
jgi:hypothetical protein